MNKLKSWVPFPVRQRLKRSPHVMRLMKRMRGDHLPFHERLTFDGIPPLEHDLYVGTHHKAGTVWLETTCLTFCELSRSTFVHRGKDVTIPRERHRVLFDYKARTEGLDLDRVRGFRMVRDPRDVIVSAMHYHRKADEPWLHHPLPRFEGRTYQQQINTLGDEDALLFEIDNSSGQVIRDMLAFDGGEAVRTIRYEDYIADSDMLLWHRLFHDLGLRRLDLLLAMQALYQNSLFGLAGGRVHIRSGGSRQWERAFTPRVRDHYEATFADAAVRLGYD